MSPPDTRFECLVPRLTTILWEALEPWEVAAGWQKYMIRMSPFPNLAASLFPGPSCCEQQLPVPVWLALLQTETLCHLFPDMTAFPGILVPVV